MNEADRVNVGITEVSYAYLIFLFYIREKKKCS